jgi:hypothetical protein
MIMVRFLRRVGLCKDCIVVTLVHVPRRAYALMHANHVRHLIEWRWVDGVCTIKAEGYFMRVWLPDYVYRAFPAVVGVAGLLGCAAGNPASFSLGGLLILYSGGVYCMRR